MALVWGLHASLCGEADFLGEGDLLDLSCAGDRRGESFLGEPAGDFLLGEVDLLGEADLFLFTGEGDLELLELREGEVLFLRGEGEREDFLGERECLLGERDDLLGDLLRGEGEREDLLLDLLRGEGDLERGGLSQSRAQWHVLRI